VAGHLNDIADLGVANLNVLAQLTGTGTRSPGLLSTHVFKDTCGRAQWPL
jgi:hypothetical protein